MLGSCSGSLLVGQRIERSQLVKSLKYACANEAAWVAGRHFGNIFDSNV